MATARTDDGIEVEWTSTSVGTDALDAALNRSIYALVEADEQDVFRHAPAAPGDSFSMSYNPAHAKIVQWGIQRGQNSDTKK